MEDRQRLERALDVIADAISEPWGRALAPLFEKMEEELLKLKAQEEVFERAQRRKRAA